MEKEIYSERTGQLLFKLFDAKRENKVSKFRIHHHTTAEIGHITGGEGIYKIENLIYKVKKGKTFFVRSDEQHCIPTVESDFLSSVNLHITPYYLWSVCTDYVNPAILKAIMSREEMNHEITGMEKHFHALNKLLYAEKSQETDSKIRRIVLMIIIELCDKIEENMCEKPVFTEKSKPLLNLENIQNAIMYIDSHFDEEVNVEKLLSVSNLSRSVFSAEFKSYTGMSAIEYLIIRRTERAVYLLKNTDMKISEIAGECGFSNLSNFNRLFKKITRITPKEYRK